MDSSTKRQILEKGLIALGLIVMSLAVAAVHYAFFGDLKYIKSYFLLHLAFLPLHALVLVMAVEALLAMRERADRKRKLSILLGVFFRQIGIELYSIMASMIDNRDEFDDLITVEPGWKRRQFAHARAALTKTKFWIKADKDQLKSLVKTLLDKEDDIVQMTRNPHLLEFPSLHQALMRLFHLIEELHFHRTWDNMSDQAYDHLANDVSKALQSMAVLWMDYLAYLKADHPILFDHQTGIHNVIDPNLMNDS